MQYEFDVMLDLLPNFLVETNMKDEEKKEKQLSGELSENHRRIR